MKYVWSGRLATPEEMEEMNRKADEAERLHFESSVADEPLIEADLRQPLQADSEADPPVIVDKTSDQRL
jgi:hypothetical protein